MFNPNNLHTLVSARMGGLSVFLYHQDNARDVVDGEDYWLNASDFGAKVGDFMIVKPAVGDGAAVHRFTDVDVNGTVEFVQGIKIDMIHAVAPALAVMAAASEGFVTIGELDARLSAAQREAIDALDPDDDDVADIINALQAT